jgi:hypothetical protein
VVSAETPVSEIIRPGQSSSTTLKMFERIRGLEIWRIVIQRADAIVVRDARPGAIARNEIRKAHYLRRTVRILYWCESGEDNGGFSRELTFEST